MFELGEQLERFYFNHRRCGALLKGHENSVRSAAFSGDGRLETPSVRITVRRRAWGSGSTITPPPALCSPSCRPPGTRPRSSQLLQVS